MKYNYGDPQRGFSFEHYNFYHSLVEMNNRQHTVIYFPFDEIMLEVGRDKMNQKLLQTVETEKPDLCFFFLFDDEIKKETIKEITKKDKSITFNWFADDHFRFYNFSKYYAPLFHWVSTTDSRAVEKYYKIGYRNVIKTQWACNHFLYQPLNLPKIYDVTFVGQSHGQRKEIIEKVKRAGLKIKTFGRGWENGSVSQEEMIRIFSQSKINLNLTKGYGAVNFKSLASILFKKGIDNSLKLYFPIYWFDNFQSFLAKRREQIKGRNFEIPGCRGFLLTSDADNLSDYYQDGKEIVVYKDINDMIEKIKYYLKNDREREEIALAGYERTLKDHTYEKRFQEIFNIIGLKK
jgi:spore maturation protein CgeB